MIFLDRYSLWKELRKYSPGGDEQSWNGLYAALQHWLTIAATSNGSVLESFAVDVSGDQVPSDVCGPGRVLGASLGSGVKVLVQ